MKALYRTAFSITASVLILLSCSKDDSGAPQMETISYLKGKVESTTPATKTTHEFSDNTLKVRWNKGDEIAVSNGTNLYKFSQTGDLSDDGHSALFKSDSPITVEEGEIIAVYPYTNDLTYDLTSQAGTIDKLFQTDLLLARAQVSTSAREDLAFKPLCAVLRFPKDSVVTDEDFSGTMRITLKGENVGGRIVVSKDGGIEVQTGNITFPVKISNGKFAEDAYVVFVPKASVGEYSYSIETERSDYFWFNIEDIRTTSIYSVKSVFRNWDNIVPPDNEIWYITNDNELIDLEKGTNQPFNVCVISHKIEDGKCVIRCDGPITHINGFAFWDQTSVTGFFMPNSIEEIGQSALDGLSLKTLRLPDNLMFVGANGIHIRSLEKFFGKHSSEDGRLVFIENGFAPDWGDTKKAVQGYVAAFASKGVDEYTLPANVKELGWSSFGNVELRELVLNEGLEAIDGNCFAASNLVCDIVLPESLVYLSWGAFNSCTGIKGFYGNNKYHSEDNRCLLVDNVLDCFAGQEVQDYVIPVGITGIRTGAFYKLPNLRSITIPSSVERIDENVVVGCNTFSYIYGPYASADNKCAVIDGHLCLLAKQGLKNYTIPDNVHYIESGVLSDIEEIESVELSDSVCEIDGSCFNNCPNLKNVVLPLFLKRIGEYSFYGSPIETIYCRSNRPPFREDNDNTFDRPFIDNIKIFVPEQSVNQYRTAPFWKKYSENIEGYVYDDIDFYTSYDYSADGVISTIQTASEGLGVNIVIMGDGFSDRQIADGTYASVMQKAADALFSEEPYKTYKDYFNVYSVNVVSVTEGYNKNGQALKSWFGEGTSVGGNNSEVISYAMKAISEEKIDEAIILVIMNADVYAGTCYMYDGPWGDYGRGLSIAYFPAIKNMETFKGVVLHEAGGHGFAKLADEYSYEYMGRVTSDIIDDIRKKEPHGWWCNVDFTSDPNLVKWGHFVGGRYANENVGCYEGGLTYWSGVWRPTEASIMRYNTGGFNAPSRYAIWYRIGKLAYGESWNGTYEDFVTYDAINRTQASEARRRAQRRNYVQKPLPQLPPPVVIRHSWKEELKKTQ